MRNCPLKNMIFHASKYLKKQEFGIVRLENLIFFSMLNKDTLTNKTCFGYRKKSGLVCCRISIYKQFRDFCFECFQDLKLFNYGDIWWLPIQRMSYLNLRFFFVIESKNAKWLV